MPFHGSALRNSARDVRVVLYSLSTALTGTGESCLAGRTTRTTTATTTTACSVRVIPTVTMKRLLQRERLLADHFIAHTLARNIRIAQDLLGHLFNLDSTEQRLARTLLRLAGYATGAA
jgi:CRP-like cAMP-binding protein